MPVDKGYWAIVQTEPASYGGFAFHIRRSQTESIKAMVGSEPGYEKRWRKVKKWGVRPRLVRVTVSWEKTDAKK